jgi:hypothetical protein
LSVDVRLKMLSLGATQCDRTRNGVRNPSVHTVECRNLKVPGVILGTSLSILVMRIVVVTGDLGKGGRCSNDGKNLAQGA